MSSTWVANSYVILGATGGIGSALARESDAEPCLLDATRSEPVGRSVMSTPRALQPLAPIVLN
ncbi:MAG: hypothetical protein WA970_03565 [Gammaproteobacteria bacterium]